MNILWTNQVCLNLVWTKFKIEHFHSFTLKNGTFSRPCPKIWCGQLPLSIYVPAPLISNQLLWMPHNWTKSLVPKGKIHNRYLFGSHMHLSSYVIGNIIYRKEITKVVFLTLCHMITAARFNNASSFTL